MSKYVFKKQSKFYFVRRNSNQEYTKCIQKDHTSDGCDHLELPLLILQSMANVYQRRTTVLEIISNN